MMKIVYSIQAPCYSLTSGRGNYKSPYAPTPKDIPVEVMVGIPHPLGNPSEECYLYLEGSAKHLVRMLETAALQIRTLAKVAVEDGDLHPQWESL